MKSLWFVGLEAFHFINKLHKTNKKQSKTLINIIKPIENTIKEWYNNEGFLCLLV